MRRGQDDIAKVMRTVKARFASLTSADWCAVSSSRSPDSLREFVDCWLPLARAEFATQFPYDKEFVDHLVGALLPYLMEEYMMGTEPRALGWLWCGADADPRAPDPTRATIEART